MVPRPSRWRERWSSSSFAFLSLEAAAEELSTPRTIAAYETPRTPGRQGGPRSSPRGSPRLGSGWQARESTLESEATEEESSLTPRARKVPHWGLGSFVAVTCAAVALCTLAVLGLPQWGVGEAPESKARVKAPLFVGLHDDEGAKAGITQPPGFTFFCSGECHNAQMLEWAIPPHKLAAKVPWDLKELPAYDAEVYEVVRDHWNTNPPLFHGYPVHLSDIASFMKALLSSNPFRMGDKVPWIDFNDPGHYGKVVSVTQRQLAFIVANVLMGNSVSVDDGLSAALKRCGKLKTNSILYSLLSFLAVLSQELKGGLEGAVLVGLKPKPGDESWRAHLHNKSNLLSPATIHLQEPLPTDLHMGCRDAAKGEKCYDDVMWAMKVGVEQHQDWYPGLTKDSTFADFQRLLWQSGLSGCHRPCEGPAAGKQDDFMDGGDAYQAVTDIAGGVVGGGAQLCAVADAQDESLVQFYTEVLAFAFFASEVSTMLLVPWTLLGARRYVDRITGEKEVSGRCGFRRDTNWLNSRIPQAWVSVPLGGHNVRVFAHSFVAVASTGSVVGRDGCTFKEAINNGCDAQRLHPDEDIGFWYRAFAPHSYHPAAQSAFERLVRRVGTGPWGAGVWWGDSQQYFLAVWVAQTLAGGSDSTLDYYVYKRFCENPGNQCFLLGGERCSDCLTLKGMEYFQFEESYCGKKSIEEVVAHFKGRPVLDLYRALVDVPGPPGQVFDLLGKKRPFLPKAPKKKQVTASHPLDKQNTAISETTDVSQKEKEAEETSDASDALGAPALPAADTSTQQGAESEQEATSSDSPAASPSSSSSSSSSSSPSSSSIKPSSTAVATSDSKENTITDVAPVKPDVAPE